MKARNVAIIMKKDLKGLANEKTILLAILLQLFIAMFSSFLMVGLTSMYDPTSVARYSSVEYGIGYAGGNPELATIVDSSRDFKVYRMDLSQAVAALKERKLSAVLYVPDTAPDDPGPIKITLYTLSNDLSSTLVEARLKEILAQYEDKIRWIRSYRLYESPVPMRFPTGVQVAPFFEFIYGILLPLLLLMPAIISAALVIDLITEEYQNKTLETLLSSPIVFSDVIFGKVAACVILAPVQAAVWILLLSLNRIPIANAPLILLHVIAGTTLLVLLGAIVALHYRERTSAQFIFSTAVVIVILSALSLSVNPMNTTVQLAIGIIRPEGFFIIGLVLLADLLLGGITLLFIRSRSEP
jgi:ABC-2 type transport system permease protein